MKYTRQERYDIYAQVYEVFDAGQAMFICHEISRITNKGSNSLNINIKDFPELRFVAPRGFYHEGGRKEWKGSAFCVNDEEPYFDHGNKDDIIEFEKYEAFWAETDKFIVQANEKTWRMTMLAFMMELCVQDDLDQWTP